MRFTVEMTELEDSQWATAQRVLQAEYDMPDGGSRVCVTIIHGEEERHVEMPIAALAGLTISLGLAPAIDRFEKAMATLGPGGVQDLRAEVDT